MLKGVEFVNVCQMNGKVTFSKKLASNWKSSYLIMVRDLIGDMYIMDEKCSDRPMLDWFGKHQFNSTPIIGMKLRARKDNYLQATVPIEHRTKLLRPADGSEDIGWASRQYTLAELDDSDWEHLKRAFSDEHTQLKPNADIWKLKCEGYAHEKLIDTKKEAERIVKEENSKHKAEQTVEIPETPVETTTEVETVAAQTEVTTTSDDARKAILALLQCGEADSDKYNAELDDTLLGVLQTASGDVSKVKENVETKQMLEEAKKMLLQEQTRYNSVEAELAELKDRYARLRSLAYDLTETVFDIGAEPGDSLSRDDVLEDKSAQIKAYAKATSERYWTRVAESVNSKSAQNAITEYSNSIEAVRGHLQSICNICSGDDVEEADIAELADVAETMVKHSLQSVSKYGSAINTILTCMQAIGIDVYKPQSEPMDSYAISDCLNEIAGNSLEIVRKYNEQKVFNESAKSLLLQIADRL